MEYPYRLSILLILALILCACNPSPAAQTPPVNRETAGAATSAAQSPYPPPAGTPLAYPIASATPGQVEKLPGTIEPRPRATLPYTPLPTSKSNTSFEITDIFFLDHQAGSVIGLTHPMQAQSGSVVMAATTDGGLSWQTISEIAKWRQGEDIPVRYIRFVAAELGFAFDPGLFATTDGGKTWVDTGFGASKSASNVHTGEDIIALEIVGGSAWAIHRICSQPHQCTLELLVYQHPQGWQKAPVQPALPGQWAQIAARDDQQIWIITKDYVQEHVSLLATHNGGETWQPAPLPAQFLGHGFLLEANPQGELWLLNAGIPASSMSFKQLFVSQDGGLTWELRARTYFRDETVTTGILPMSGYPSELSVPSSKRAYLAEGTWGSIAATQDGGRTWFDPIHYGLLAGAIGIGRVFFVDETHGWASTQNYVFRTTDGGLQWTVSQVP